MSTTGSGGMNRWLLLWYGPDSPYITREKGFAPAESAQALRRSTSAGAKSLRAMRIRDRDGPDLTAS